MRIYCLARRDESAAHRPFVSGTTFDQIAELYRFDEELRSYVFLCCSKIEIILRNAVSEELTSRFGPHAHLNHAIYRSGIKKVESIAKISEICKRRHNDARIANYYAKYGDPALPPFWLVKECLTFGTANIIIGCLSTGLQKAIAKRLGLPTNLILMNWIACFVDVRNACAHHDRVFNRKFQKSPERFARNNLPAQNLNPNKISAVLECMSYLITRFDQNFGNTHFALRAMMAQYPAVTETDVGLR